MLTQASGPDWPWIVGVLVALAGVLLGFVVALTKLHVNALALRLASAEQQIRELNTLMLRDYHNKSDLNHILSEIKDSVRSLHEKIDRKYGGSSRAVEA